jgi:DNA excision repair protein ERCC-2
MTEYTVAVRALAEFCHRQGDIDYRFTPSPTGEQGIAGHQQVTAGRGADYLAEVSLEHSWELDGFTLCLRGRADGYDARVGYIEEIKTCRVEPAAIPAAVEAVQWAQAMLYAGLLLLAEPARERLDVHLTWFNIDTGQQWTRSDSLSRVEIEGFLRQTIERYGQWLDRLHRWRSSRNASIESLSFPHENFRSGQRDMAESVYKCISQGGQLLLQAPTGIGKTAAVLFPALKALAADKHDLLTYVTARTVGRQAAEQALAEMSAQGLQLRRLSLTARDSICFSPGKACHGDDCPFARGYYDRLPAALDKAIGQADLSRPQVELLAREFDICPYQLSLDLIPWVDLCIADIHYVYSFNATIAGLNTQGTERWTVLLDEAHNLPDRARSMFSASLSKAALMQARNQAYGEVKRCLDRCNRCLLALQKQDWQEAEFHSSETLPESLLRNLQLLVAAISEQQAENPLVLQQRPDLLDFYFAVLQFQRVQEVFAADFRFEMSRGEGQQSLSIRLHCLDGSRLLAERQQQLHSVTAFSATVSPPQWVLSALGFEERAVYRNLPSPFAADQYQVYLNTRLDTRFRARAATTPALCGVILQWLENNPGNCIVYFPAYRYMEEALAGIAPHLVTRHLIAQEREQGQLAREQLLQALRSRMDVVAFCILGGVFGESIDLPGDALTSVVIVGVGLPQFNRQRQVLRDYYDHKSGLGYQYAYQYPGMQKVSQALGRVIRRESDRGSALLIDNRYGESSYRALLPAGWDYREAE